MLPFDEEVVAVAAGGNWNGRFSWLTIVFTMLAAAEGREAIEPFENMEAPELPGPFGLSCVSV